MSSIFRIIETFFFISLGITFILVLLLVFHFKIRLLSLEEKHDTTLEIINNIVGELQYIKKSGINEPDIKRVNMVVEPLNGGNGHIELGGFKPDENNKVFVSDGENDDESEVESDDEGEDESDDESEDESEDEGEHESVDECSVGNDTYAIDIKIIKLDSDNIETPITADIATKKEHEHDCVYSDGEREGGDSNERTEQDVDSTVIETKNDEVDIEIEIPEIDVSNYDGDDIVADSNFDDYRKLNVQSLKNIAISKGLSTDPSKLKKKELLHLLA
jgi:hypothetical protein